MIEGRTLCWFSSGAASAVATKLTIAECKTRGYPEPIVVQCDMRRSEDEDNVRFTQECEPWFGQEVVHLGSSKFSSVDEVFEKRKYHSGMNGAPCAGELKTAPRLDFQRPSDTHVWGYTADSNDIKRFARMQRVYSEMKQRAPLIERGITKEGCLAIIERAGIAPPRVYSLGFTNANCIGCVKSTSPAYWALVRQEFPEVFARRAEQSRRFGSRLTHLPGKGDERFFIDEIPSDFPTKEAVSAQCDFLCALAEEDLT